jgi:hypothetical protein
MKGWGAKPTDLEGEAFEWMDKHNEPNKCIEA